MPPLHRAPARRRGRIGVVAGAQLARDGVQRLPAGEARLGLPTQRRPGVGTGELPPGGEPGDAGEVRVERPVPRPREAAGRLPDGHQADGEIAPRPAAGEFIRAVVGAQPNAHAEGKVQGCPRAATGPHADRAGRRRPHPPGFVERLGGHGSDAGRLERAAEPSTAPPMTARWSGPSHAWNSPSELRTRSGTDSHPRLWLALRCGVHANWHRQTRQLAPNNHTGPREPPAPGISAGRGSVGGLRGGGRRDLRGHPSPGPPRRSGGRRRCGGDRGSS